jgi:hypothetical protein
MNALSDFPLTFLRLRFTCEAITAIRLDGYRAGSNLRGALLNVMRRATCVGNPDDPAHVAVCPVCWLAAANENPGRERRGYALVPPLRPPKILSSGERFTFRITLFGDAARYFPYFVLAVPEAGRVGVGIGRGQFILREIYSEHLLGEDWEVLKEGDTVVHPPPNRDGHEKVLQKSEILLNTLPPAGARVTLRFHTPTRLIYEKRLMKSPDFGVLFARLLERLDRLAIQHAGGETRSQEARERLWNAADRVRLVEDATQWVEISSGSRRTGRRTWLSGFVGEATYAAPKDVWKILFPWLVWGEMIQVGKDTAKGNGVYSLLLRERSV